MSDCDGKNSTHTPKPKTRADTRASRCGGFSLTMAKRFIDTDLFRKPFMRGLEAPYKALWIYLLCECDHAGVWVVELDVAQIRMGLKLDPEKVIEKMGGAVVPVDGGSKWYLPDFVAFQYGELNPANRVHESVIKRLTALGIDPANPSENKPLASPFEGAKDKDKDKDMDNSNENIQELEVENNQRRARSVQPDMVAPDAYADEWNEWLCHRREIKKPMTLRSQRAQLAAFDDWTVERIKAAITHSIANGWQGIFEPKQNTNGQPTGQVRPEQLSVAAKARLAIQANAEHHARMRDAGPSYWDQ